MRQVHPIAPVWDSRSRVQVQFFYGHPQNRFWPLLARLLEAPVPQTVVEKRALLLHHHIALWDVVASCEITGSSDSSIRDVIPNDLSPILTGASIEKICCNGALAHKLYVRYLQPVTGLEALRLPSTSPANAQWSADRLAEMWRCILPV